jgi:hypothetical protein
MLQNRKQMGIEFSRRASVEIQVHLTNNWAVDYGRQGRRIP